MGQAVPTNALYTNVKTLLERVAPVMIDLDAMTALVTLLDDAVNGLREINDDIPDVVSKGMKLLSVRWQHDAVGVMRDQEKLGSAKQKLRTNFPDRLIYF